MQKNKGGQGPQPVYKPYLKGNIVSGFAAKRGPGVLGMMVVFAFMYVLIGTFTADAARWIVIPVNALMVLGSAFVMFNAGAMRGETDTAFAEIARNRLDSGKTVPDSEKDRCFNPLKGCFSALVGAAPIILIAAVFAFVAHRQTVSIGTLPSWVSAYTAQDNIGPALEYYNETTVIGLEDILRIVVRVFIFPFVNIVGTTNYGTLFLLDRLSPLIMLLLPAVYGIGYTRGPHLRAMVHGSIRQNRRRHNRRERRAREQRASSNKKELI